MASDRQLIDVRVGQERHRDVQERAAAQSISAIRAIESRLVEALDGERLRGLPNLGNDEHRFHAARVRGRYASEVLPFDGREILVVDGDGWIVFAAFSRQGVVTKRALDDELLAEDVALLSERAQQILAAHLSRLERSTARYEKLEELATRLVGVLGPAFAPAPRVGD